MLSPVSAVSVMGAALDKSVTAVIDTPDTQTAAATPLIALSNAVNASIEGRLNILLATVRERMFDSLLAAINAVGEALNVTQEPQESASDFVQRLASAISNLSPDELDSVQQQLSASSEVTIPLPLIAEALDNPEGSVAAQIGVSYETNLPPQQPDAALKAVVSSYGQNAGEPQTIASQNPLPAQALPDENVSANAPSLPPAADDTAPQQAATAPIPTAATQPGPSQASLEAPIAATPQIPTTPADGEAAGSNPVPVATTSGDTSTASAPAQAAQPNAAQAQPATSFNQPAATAANADVPANLASASPVPADPKTGAAQASPPVTQPQIAGQTQQALPAQTSAAAQASAGSTSASTSPAATPLAQQAADHVPASPVPSQASSALPTQTAATAQALPNPTSATSNSASANVAPAIAAAVMLAADQPDPVVQPQAVVSPELARPETAAEMESNLPIEIALIRSPVTPPPIPRVIQEIRAEIKLGLEVVIGRAIDLAGPELLSVIKDNAPLAERVIAQAMAANVADEEVLQTLPRPPDEEIKSNSTPANLSQMAASMEEIADEPSSKLSAAIAAKLATNTQPPVVDIPDAGSQMRAMMPQLQGIPFVISPYTPVDVEANEDDSLDVDRVDPVDDEEQSEDQGGAMAQDDADEEAPHHEETGRHAAGAPPVADAAETDTPKAVASTSELLALPMAMPAESVRDHAFDYYQRMGAWE